MGFQGVGQMSGSTEEGPVDRSGRIDDVSQVCEEETGQPGLELGCSLDTPRGDNRRVRDRAMSKRKTGKHGAFH